MLDGTICDLSAHDDVEHGDYANKPGDAPQGSFAIEAWLREPLAYLPLAEEDSDGDQYQSGKEDQREYEKDDDSDVGIIYMPADLQWQHKEPRNDRGRKKSEAEQAEPVPSQQKPRRPFRCAIHRVKLKTPGSERSLSDAAQNKSLALFTVSIRG